MPKLRIAEIFTSIQGEGMWVGLPSTFVRISGCNLRCGWCDTPYASWEPEGPTTEISQIADQVRKVGVQHVVVTGGEPMLFEPVIQLCEALKRGGHTITIETAGTVFRELPCDLMSISPKLANSTPSAETAGRGWVERHESIRSNLEPLRQLIARYLYQLKFVVNPESGDDVSEIKNILNEIGEQRPSHVLLMAEGRDSETLHTRERLLVPICIQEGWRLCSRLQIDLFGDRRGT